MASTNKMEKQDKDAKKTKKANKIAGILEEGMQWWDIEPRLGKRAAPARIPETSNKRPTASEVESFRERGLGLIEEAAEAYANMRASQADGDDKFMDQMLKAGTLADRVAAMTLRIQQSPMHELSTIDALLKLCGKGNHRGARLAMEALVDLYKGNLLPDDRVLFALEQRPLTDPGITNEHVLVWTYEAGIKTRFSQLIEYLSVALKDNTGDFRKFGMDCIADLLESKPEQEQTLLTMCVNKLGDPDRKVASRATYRLQLLLKKHSVMIPTVVQFVQAYLARVNLAARGVYNGVVFLNQIYLDRGSHDLAASLVHTYLGLFTKAVNAGELKSRLLAALLTGVARAQPFLDRSSVGRGALAEHVDTLFKMVHVGSFSASTQALSILFHFICVSDPKAKHFNTKEGSQNTNGNEEAGSLVHRFYRSLYAKLGSGDYLKTTKPTLFLNLIFKALKADTDPARVCSFAKRMLQQSLSGPSPHAAATLFMLSHVAHSQESVAGLLQQFAKVFENIKAGNKKEEDEEGEEGENNGEEKKEEGGKEEEDKEANAESSDESDDDASKKEETNKEEEGGEERKEYDPSARDPRSAGGANSLLWELDLYSNHFHPSVKAFAESLLSPEDGYSITYEGDPLVDFSTIAFLDRIVYKQPKASKRSAGAARMGSGRAQALETLSKSGQVLLGAGELMNSKAFLELDEEQVAPDQLFFHKFFTLKHAQRKGKARALEGMVEEDSNDEEEMGYGDDEDAEDDEIDNLQDDDEDDDEDDDGDLAGNEIDLETAQRMLDEDEDTDEEEREFADALAEGYMKRYAERQGGNKKSFRDQLIGANTMAGDIDEIPDWALEEEEKGSTQKADKKSSTKAKLSKKQMQDFDDFEEEEDDEEFEEGDDDFDEDDDDALINFSDSEDDEEEEEMMLEDAITSSKSKGAKQKSASKKASTFKDSDSEDDDDIDGLIDLEDSESEEEAPIAVLANKKGGKVKKNKKSPFAAANDFESMIEQDELTTEHDEELNLRKKFTQISGAGGGNKRKVGGKSKEEAWEAGELGSRSKRSKANQKKGKGKK